jgi:methyl-accepting chemotaxis protein
MHSLIRTLNWFSGLRIGVRLSLAFAGVLSLTGLLGAVAIFNLAHVNQTSDDLAHKWLPSVVFSTSARAALLEFRELELKHTHATDASYYAEYEDKMKDTRGVVDAQMAELSPLMTEPAERSLAEQFTSKWNEYLGINKKVTDLGRANKAEDAREIGDGAAKQALDDALLALDAITAFASDGGKQAAKRAAVVYTQSRLWTLVLLAASLVVGLLLSVLISRGLLVQLGGEPTVAAQLASAVADGDLSTTIRIKAGDSSSLMACLLHMQTSLSEVVSTVRQGSVCVATASGEIAQGNLELSSRTEQQAAALEETSASMEQLGATVRQNADHARQADALAKSASTVASRGGEVVGRVMHTMRGINESSRKIGDIIAVIDGIAFQTNILALNAAVEAARAGEQGRGFAVVASEVRGLAHRSAAAAREIKDLINASVQRVEDGSKLADEAGTTMNEVVDAIARVNTIMSEISAASQRQSAGVEQVSQAVTQMDQATQQNAAMVEQSAAAAGSLREQAQDLVNVVAAFRLAEAAA